MKKTTLFFLAVAIVAVSTAFTIRVTDTVVKKDATTFVIVNPLLKGNTTDPGGWDCFPIADTCLFIPKAGAVAPYTRDELDPDLSAGSVNKQFGFYNEP